MTARTVLVATRSPHKLREIREMIPPDSDLDLVSLSDAGVAYSEEEDAIEVFPSFEENALAKAKYFRARSGLSVLADDSGLCVDALAGAPGVRSKRFSPRPGLSGVELDLANNRHLLDLLVSVPPPRTAHYVCVIAVADETDEATFRGTVEGQILDVPIGSGGFGYDPLFWVPELNATFAQVSLDVKNQLSHRARALEAALPHLLAMAR